MIKENLLFSEHLHDRIEPSGIDVQTSLAHFAIITYLIDPAAARRLIHDRFELDLLEVDGLSYALLSVVPFVDFDFRFTNLPWFNWRFGQTNYRIYVTDSETGEHVVWFLGTTLDSNSVVIPRYLWKLPWHRGQIRFDCEFDEANKRYAKYRMVTSNSWADGEVELQDSGEMPSQLDGFSTVESGLVLLTHPRLGYYYRRDGKLGTYSIWHDRLEPSLSNVSRARFDLLDRLQLTRSGDLSNVHSVLICRQADFTVYLPPRIVPAAKC